LLRIEFLKASGLSIDESRKPLNLRISLRPVLRESGGFVGRFEALKSSNLLEAFSG
jgi:hypothetical protein